MGATEKVIFFSTFEELTQEIKLDMDSKDMLSQRYAVRFIMLNNFNEFKRLAKFMADSGVSMLDIEDINDVENEDRWITKDMLKMAIKSCKESTFVTPFSELVRFYNEDEFRGFLNEIILLEDIRHPQKRIYIPLIGLQNRFSDFLSSFARITESAPIWRYDAEPQSVEVFFTSNKNFILPSSAADCQLKSLREWLMFWKSQAPQPRIICTSLPIAAKQKYSKPDNIFKFNKISNAYEFITNFLELTIPFEYNEDEESYWNKLLSKLGSNPQSNFNVEKFVSTYFNKIKLNASDIIVEWNKTSNYEFERWLLRNYVIYTDFRNEYPYVALCVEMTTDFKDENLLNNTIATRILYDSNLPVNIKSKYAQERRKVIINNKSIFIKAITTQDQEWLQSRIMEEYNQQNDLAAVIDLCTGIYSFEKNLLIGLSVLNQGDKSLQTAIAQYYPDFAAYLETNQPSIINKENLWCIEYLKAYKQAKLADKYLSDISDFIKTKNSSSESFYKWYYEFQSSHDALEEMRSQVAYRPDKVYWIDGLGIEFLSLILKIVENDNGKMKVVRSQITRSELPSSTYHNKFEGEYVTKYSDLDELGHDSHGYKYIGTLKKELEIVKDIVLDILNSNKKTPCTIAIVSDHGMSCLSRKAPSKKYDGKFEHEGRYIKTTSEAMSDSDYLVKQNDTDSQYYKIALTHSSLSKVPTHQVHGGCTPEEVLVPFILLSNKELAKSIKYQIKLTSCDIMLSCPEVVLTVIPEPLGVMISCDGKQYVMQRQGIQWRAMLEDVSAGEYKIDVKPEGAASQGLKINIVGIGGDSITDLMEDF
jgi:hypothetical protein